MTAPLRDEILGLPVDRVEMAGALARMETWIEAKRSQREASPAPARQIVTLNPEMAMAARRDAGLRAAILGAGLVVADGVGITLAARLLGRPTLARVTGVDLLDAFAERAARRGWRLFLLGAAPGVAQQAAQALQARAPGLATAGAVGGSPGDADERAILARIAAARPDALFVAFGSPAQERWIARLAEPLGAQGVAVAVGVGGAFDMLAGRTPRAPRWMRRAGLEWLYRLWREPWRWRRMLALPRFALAALCETLWR